MTDTPRLIDGNRLLRAALSSVDGALRAYHDAPHFEIDDDITKWEVIVPEEAREKASDALAKAAALLERARIERGR